MCIVLSFNWQGGAEFSYCELKQNTAELMNKITSSKTTDELLLIEDSIKDYTFIDYRINLEFLQDKDKQQFKDFESLEFEKQQQVLIIRAGTSNSKILLKP